jgi:hypothetical protein
MSGLQDRGVVHAEHDREKNMAFDVTYVIE